MNLNLTPRDKLLLYFALGSMLMANDSKAAPTPPAIDPEYIEGADVAKSGGKLKTNPYEGGSAQWWAWNNGYKAAKAQEAKEQRRSAAAF